MASIKSIKAYEILDSRGYPTIEGILVLDNGMSVSTTIPSGTTVSKYEAIDLRDGDENRFEGQGVTKAVQYINELIGPKLVNVSPLKQQEIDGWLKKADGTTNKEKPGGNTILTVSQLVIKAAAMSEGVPLFKYIKNLYEHIFKETIPMERIPVPIFSMINGGKHANNTLDFQEFQIIPSSSLSFERAFHTGIDLFHELKKILEYRHMAISTGEQGGYTPDFASNLDALDVIQETILQRKLKPGLDIFVGLDLAPSYFFKDDRYVIKDKPHPLKRDEYIAFLKTLMSEYSMLIIEDPIIFDDWEGWKKMNEAVPENVYLTADDLISSNKERFMKAIHDGLCSAIVIKPNQLGTISETMEVINIAKKNGITTVISHRSGETNDDFIADLAVGVQADFVKFGAPSRGERIAKYNRLWRIERDEFPQPIQQ